MMSTRIMSLPFISPSSPPPIDSDQLTDGDEDFGHYVGQEDTFDITGLSQKFSTTEKENDISLRTTSTCTLLESISNVCIQNTDIGKSNLNEFPVYSESSECTSAASEPLSLATPPPLDCVGTFLETNYSEESPVHQNYTNESEDEFGDFVIGQDNIDVPVVINYIESNNEILFHNKPQSCQDIITDCQGVNDLVTSSKSPVNDKEILSNQAHTNVDNSLKEFPETADCVLINNKDIFIIDNCNTTEISCSEITTTRPSGSVTTTNNSSENLEAITCTSPCKNEDEKDIIICPERLDEPISFNEFKIYNSSKVTNSVSSNKVEPSTKVLGDVITQCSSGSNENEIHVYLEDDISEFGDFADFETSKNEPVIQHDFDNDFSDVSEEENSELEKELRNKIDLAINDDDDDDDDEFGEFNSNIGFCEEKRFCKNEFSWTQSAGEEMVSLHSSKVYCKEIGDDRANQFDTFILKWVPLEPCFNEDSIGRKILQKLDEVLEGDAFIWHHLEDIDSCLALKLVWPSTQANKLFLNSLNVDARNIVSKDSMLFGHKWSSSVPLFAQTLSFSPLTPAKPTEAPVTLANTWSIIEDKKAISKSTEASTKSTWNESSGSISKLEILCEPTLKSNVTSRTEKDAKDKENEGIIPPAQFDWSSSGLTNPLDAQACLSTLFDYKLLIANPNGSSGATSSALSSLEKEILSNSPMPVLKNENDLNHTSFNMLDKLMKGKELAKTTSFESLPLKVKNVVKDLPDLNYMKCKVLMFPIRGETNS